MKEEVTLYKYARDRWGEGPMKLHKARAIKQTTRYMLLEDLAVFDYRTFIPFDLGHEIKADAYKYAFDRLCKQVEGLRSNMENAERSLDELRLLNPSKP